MTIKRIAVQRLGVQHELTDLRCGRRGHHGDRAAELVRRAGLALTDAFDFRSVKRIDLLTELTVSRGDPGRGRGSQEAFTDRGRQLGKRKRTPAGRAAAGA